jgi:hypothetical protein
MKKRTFVLLALMLPTVLTAQTFIQKWSEKTAYTLEKGKWESGIFQSFRWGLNDRIELRTNALLLPIFPNAGIKIALGEKSGWLLASEHALSYPTLLLKSLSFKGTGGMLSPEFSYPTMISLSNTLLATKPLGVDALFSAEIGVSFTIHGQNPDYQSSIDYPVLYPRMAHYYEGVSLRVGGSYKRQLWERWYLEENAKWFVITRNRDNLFLENAGTVMWAVGRSLRIRGGYNLSWGTYPFGNQLQLCPTIDLVFGSRK